MASRQLSDRVRAGVNELVFVELKVTGAADVNANGYTVDRGGGYVATVARGGEGVMNVTLRDPWPALLMCAVTISKADTVPSLSAESVAASKTFSVTFTTAGSAADPDSAVIRLLLAFSNSATVI